MKRILQRARQPVSGRAVLACGLAVLGAGVGWAWQTGLLGSRFLPASPAVAAEVATLMERTAAGGHEDKLNAQLRLVKLGPPATRPLLTYLNHEQPRVRSVAAIALGHVGDWSVVDALGDKLQDPAPEVRHASVLALHRLAAREACELLRMHADDSDGGTRAAIAMALGDLHEAENVATLANMVRDENVAVRFMSLVSLGRLGEPAGVPALVRGLNDPYRRNRDAAVHSLSLVTGLPAHREGHLWLAWWALHRRA